MFRLDLPGTTPGVIHSFDHLAPHRPTGGVIAGDTDWLYGMIGYNGIDHHGGAYKIRRDGTGFSMIATFTDIFGSVQIPYYHTDGNIYFTNQSKLKKYNPVTSTLTEFDMMGVLVSRSLLIDANDWVYIPTFNGLAKMKTDGTLWTDLHTFNEATEGMNGWPGLTEVSGDTIFGVQAQGGTNSVGTIYSIKKDGTGFIVHHHFTAATGARPLSRLEYFDGRLFGTTSEGGDHNLGVLYTINTDGSGYRVLHHFAPGSYASPNPYGNIAIASNGRIFGSFSQFHVNGTSQNRLYKVDTSGAGFEPFYAINQRESGHFNQDILLDDETIYLTTQEMGRHEGGALSYTDTLGFGASLYNFGLSPNGFRPRGLIRGSNGLLYGVNTIGGTSGNGVIYSINQNGTGFVKLHEFTDGEGYNATGKLLEASDGKLYGVLQYEGPAFSGSIYRMDKNGSNFQVLHDFQPFSNGHWPVGHLIEDEQGLLYGVANYSSPDVGAVYKINKDGTGYTVLKNFTASELNRPFVGLYLRGDYLYGVCAYGGPENKGGIFRVRRDGTGYEELHVFSGATDGAQPMGALWLATNGRLYGTTMLGGTNGEGTLFVIDTTGNNYAVLRNFSSTVDGGYPQAQLLQASDRLIYGTTFVSSLGGGGGGTVFRMNLDGSGFAVVHEFNTATGGQGPQDLLDLNGNFALPVELLTFNAQKKDKTVSVNWKTAQEQNSSHFEVERSAEGSRFTTIGKVTATGNTNALMSYSFPDQTPLKGNNFYRLKLVDDDGSFTYSKIVSLNFNNTGSVVVSPNPAPGRLHVQLPAGHSYTVLSITDVSGKQVLQRNIASSATGVYIDIHHLPGGMYLLQLSNATEREQVPFIKR